MRRSLLTVLIVAAISGWISRSERAAGPPAAADDWVRTADGWQSRAVVAPREISAPPPVHPAMVAAFQLGASLFFLIAFPPRVSAAPARLLRPAAGVTRRAARRVLAAS